MDYNRQLSKMRNKLQTYHMNFSDMAFGCFQLVKITLFSTRMTCANLSSQQAKTQLTSSNLWQIKEPKLKIKIWQPLIQYLYKIFFRSQGSTFFPNFRIDLSVLLFPKTTMEFLLDLFLKNHRVRHKFLQINLIFFQTKRHKNQI